MQLVQRTPKAAEVTADISPTKDTLQAPTRSFSDGTRFERAVGFAAASVFSLTYVAAPLYCLACAISLFSAGPMSTVTLALWLPLIISMLLPELSKTVGPYVLKSWPMRQIPKYFEYEEYCEFTDSEILGSGKNYVVGAHPHGVFSFCGVCCAVATINATDGLGTKLCTRMPTAAASVISIFPVLKDVLGIFGVIKADRKSLANQLTKGSFVLYVGGMIELFRSSSKREAVFLKQRKGFIKLALREGADIMPMYLFGNTTVLNALTAGALASLSRKLGVSVTLFWGRFGLPLPKRVRLTYARGRPLGLPHIPEPSDEEVELWHSRYIEQLVELFDKYKGTNPDYAHKELCIE